MPINCILSCGNASLHWLREQWDKGRTPDPDPELLVDERLRF
jgi:hypothetical protein